MKDELSFEAGMSQLEEIVKSLEDGSLPLDACFDAYERGILLIKALNARLDAGEKRISMLTEQGEIPFDVEDGV